MNVRCSSSSTEATVKFNRQEYRNVFSGIVVAVHSKLLALITSSGLQLLFSWGLNQLSSFLNMQTFVLAPFYYHLSVFTCFNIFQRRLCTRLAKCVTTEWKKVKLTYHYHFLFILSTTWNWWLKQPMCSHTHSLWPVQKCVFLTF